MSKKDSMVVKGLQIEGEVKFSDIHDPQPGKTKEGKIIPASFSMTLVMDKGDKNVTKLDELLAKMVAHELEGIDEDDQMGLTPSKTVFRADKKKDEQGNLKSTGRLQLAVRRSLAGGPPMLVDGSLEPLTRKFIGSGSTVKLQVNARSYTVAGKVGMTLELVAIQVVNEMSPPTGGARPVETKDLVFKTEEPVDETKTAFKD